MGRRRHRARLEDLLLSHSIDDLASGSVGEGRGILGEFFLLGLRFVDGAGRLVFER